MKAIILSHEDNGTYVLKSDGTFEFVNGYSSHPVGDEIELGAKPVIQMSSFMKIASLAACLILVLSISIFTWLWNQTSSYVYIDINPSIELQFNHFNSLKATIPLCDDAVTLLDGLVLSGKMEKVIIALINEAEKKNFIYSTNGVPAVLITIVSAKDKSTLALENAINSALEKQGISCYIIETCNMDYRDRALNLGVSPGKLQLAEALMLSSDGAFILEDFLKMRVKELYQAFCELSTEDTPAPPERVLVDDTNVPKAQPEDPPIDSGDTKPPQPPTDDSDDSNEPADDISNAGSTGSGSSSGSGQSGSNQSGGTARTPGVLQATPPPATAPPDSGSNNNNPKPVDPPIVPDPGSKDPCTDENPCGLPECDKCNPGGNDPCTDENPCDLPDCDKCNPGGNDPCTDESPCGLPECTRCNPGGNNPCTDENPCGGENCDRCSDNDDNGRGRSVSTSCDAGNPCKLPDCNRCFNNGNGSSCNANDPCNQPDCQRCFNNGNNGGNEKCTGNNPCNMEGCQRCFNNGNNNGNEKCTGNNPCNMEGCQRCSNNGNGNKNGTIIETLIDAIEVIVTVITEFFNIEE